MDIQRFLPWRKHNSDNKPAVRNDDQHPLVSLQQAMNNLFDSFWQDFGSFGNFFPSLPSFGGGAFTPKIDVSDNGGAYVVSAELPGMSENDIDITLANGVLTIRGEKRHEREDRSDGHYLLERSYGVFHRSLTLPSDALADGVEATFKNGVLSVQVPKSRETRAGARKIAVRSA